MAAAGSTPPRQVFRVSVPLDREMKREGRMGAVFRFTHCVHYRRVHSPPLFGHSIQSNQLWWIKVTLCHWNSTTYNSLFAEDFLLGGQGFVVKRVHCSGCHMARRSDAAAIFHCVSVISFVTRECHGWNLIDCDVINYLIVMILLARRENERDAERGNVTEKFINLNTVSMLHCRFFCRWILIALLNNKNVLTIVMISRCLIEVKKLYNFRIIKLLFSLNVDSSEARRNRDKIFFFMEQHKEIWSVCFACLTLNTGHVEYALALKRKRKKKLRP